MNIPDAMKIIRAESRRAKNEAPKNKDAMTHISNVNVSIKEIQKMLDKMLDLSNTSDVDYRNLIKNEVNFCFDSIADVYFIMYMSSDSTKKERCKTEDDRLRGMKI